LVIAQTYQLPKRKLIGLQLQLGKSLLSSLLLTELMTTFVKLKVAFEEILKLPELNLPQI
jgi:hypothetical protein